MMASVESLLGLEREVFAQWVSGERRRLPGITSGFASLLALLRMTRPVQVVWVSDGREGEDCGLDAASVARVLVDLLGPASQLLWFGTDSEDLSYLPGIGGESAVSSVSVLCVPRGYEVRLESARAYGLLTVVRIGEDWSFGWLASHADTDAGVVGSAGVAGDESDGGTEVDAGVKRRRRR